MKVPDQSDQDSVLPFTGGLNSVIQSRREPFLMNIVDIPAPQCELAPGCVRRVLVEFEPHQLRRKRNDPFAREFGRESQRRRHMFGAQ